MGYDGLSDNLVIGRLDTKFSKLRNEPNLDVTQETENETELLNDNNEFDSYSYLKRKLTKFNDEDYPQDFKQIIKVRYIYFGTFFLSIKLKKK
jgi:hypothetical protein